MSNYIEKADELLKARDKRLHTTGKAKDWPEVRADDLATEFPGLDAICRKVFDVTFSDATPNLREHVRIIATRDAAEKMYKTIRASLTFLPCHCKAAEIHSVECPRGQCIEAIMAAEGRTVYGVKSGS